MVVPMLAMGLEILERNVRTQRLLEATLDALAQAGVAVQAVRLPGMVHACMHMLGLAPASRRLFDEAGVAVRQAFGTAIG